MGRENQIRGIVTLAYALTLTVDASQGNVFVVGSLTGNTAIAVKNVRPGHDISVVFTQDGVGTHIVDWAGSGGMTITPPISESFANAWRQPNPTAGATSTLTLVGISTTEARIVKNSDIQSGAGPS